MTEIDHRPMNGYDPPECEYVPEYACEVCGAEITVYDSNRYWGLCEECYTKSKEFEDSLTLENCLKCDKETIEIPSCLAYFYDEKEITDIIIAHFKEVDENSPYGKIIMKDYALEDVSEWAERVNNG